MGGFDPNWRPYAMVKLYVTSGKSILCDVKQLGTQLYVLSA
jgi:hypothetical protein